MVQESTNLVSDEDGGALRTCCDKPSALRKIVVLLSVLICCLIILFIVVALQIGPDDRQMCTTSACVQSSAYILKKMNQSVDPCEDFYQYSCGGWLDHVTIPPDKPEWNMFSEASYNNMQTLREIIESEGSVFKGVNSSAIAKLKTFYRTCMDEETIEKQGIAPVLKLINELGSWNVTSKGLVEWDRKNWTLQKSLADMHKLGRSSLFDLGMGQDAKNSSRNILTFCQSGLTLEHKDEYTSSQRFKDAFLVFAVRVGLLLGGNYTDVSAKMSDIFEFEKKLAEITVPNENLTSYINTYNKMTIEDFQKLLGSWVDIKQYMSDNFYGRAFGDKEEVIVASPSYFKKLGEILEGTDKEVLANYMMWNMLQSMPGYFPDEFSKAALSLSKVEIGVTSLPERWKRCLAKAGGILSFASGALFVEKRFSVDSKTKVMAAVEEVKHQFIINLDDVSWLDKVTREQLKDKASSVSSRVGYPDWILDPVKLDQRYEKLQVVDGEFLSSRLQAIEYMRNRTIDLYGKAPDPKEWTSDIIQVNARYDFTINAVYIPAGILQVPFYAPEFPEPFIYGSIGMIVGHEVTHGFDREGRLFDKHGNLADMWTQSAVEAFKKNSQCMIDKYSAYTLQGKHLNGVLTLGENIADNGGLKFAFKAYKAASKKSNAVLPGLNLTDDQLFFIGFSQLWCARSKPENERTSILTNSHPNKAFRVIGSMSNSKDFATAFKCDLNSRMNPRDKCTVW